VEAMLMAPAGLEWTHDDLDALPEGGPLRYELVDGQLLVSPPPSIEHQRVSRHLLRLLHDACPPELEVLYAPVDFRPTSRRSLQPDLLVFRHAEVGEKAITQGLVLAVEILSPSTRSVDLVLKRALYEEAGVTSYWVVDPLEPSITAWELVDGVYVEAGRAVGEDALRLTVPYDVAVVPAALTR
jgi:Uma2 family endonuclease